MTTTAPDGILKGYSEILGLSLCWDDNWPRLYDPATSIYLTNWRQERAARQAEREAAESRAVVEQAERLAERVAREAAETRAASERPARVRKRRLLSSGWPARRPRRASASWRPSYVVGKRTASRADPAR